MRYFFFLSFLALFITSGCEFFTNTGENETSTIEKIVEGGIEYSLSLPTHNFSLRDTLVMSFNVKNNSSTAKTYNFANVQQLGFNLTNRSGRTVISYPMIVSPALSSFTVNPGENKTLTVRSLFKNSEGNYIPTGTYRLTAYLLDRNSPHLSLRISIN